MNRLFSWTALALGLFLGMGQNAWAQYAPYSPYSRPTYGPYSRPPVSPYLNIIRGNNTPAVNYYTGTVPERENRARFNQVNSDLQNLERRPGAPALTPEELIPILPETGHPVQFMNVNPYYSYGPGFNPGLQQTSGQFNRPGGARPQPQQPRH